MPNSCLGLVLLVGLLPAQQPVVGVQRPIGLVTPALVEAPKALRTAQPREVQPRETQASAPSEVQTADARPDAAMPSAARSIDGDPSDTDGREPLAVEVRLPATKPPAPTESALSVPEPSMLLAVGGGLVLLALAKRRRRGGRTTPQLPR